MFKSFRKKYGLSQADMAKLCGVARTTYQYWEKNGTTKENKRKVLKAMIKVNNYAKAVRQYRQNQISIPKQEIKKISYTAIIVGAVVLLMLCLGSLF